MDYEKTRKDAGTFLSLTSLHVEEFDLLCEEFEQDWWGYYRYHTVRGQKRKVPLCREHGNCSLPTTEAKLFFLLVYLKQYPLQRFQAASFGLSVGKTNEWVQVLTRTLDTTLGRMKLLPCRNGDLLESVLGKMGVATVNLDATERKVQRSVDPEVQREHYSGKKKAIRSRTTFW